ncbi:hypothetical protein C8J56DRAFT_1160630 [Mycena floridula]|nr:hypothetical protein C8J56DRAFT_1160630 [Mycena floridula]
MPVLTRRATLAQKSILNVLPNELTTEIIWLCDSSSQAALCRVSKLSKQLAHRLLYHTARLNLPRKFVSFHAGLSANPQYGAWVKNIDAGKWHPLFSDRSACVTAILNITTELHQLTVCAEDVPYLETMSFAHLRILTIKGYPSYDYLSLFTSFLNCYLAISHLAVNFTYPIPSEIPRADLPNLATFDGRDLNLLGHTPRLISMQISITQPEDLDVLARFPSCLNIRIYADRLVRMYHVQDVLKRLPLPHLKSCMILDYDSESFSRLESVIAEELSRFKQLESFCLVISAVKGSGDRASTIESWLKSCPSLQECALLDSTRARTGRYKVVDGKVQPTAELCRMEKIFRNEYRF